MERGTGRGTEAKSVTSIYRGRLAPTPTGRLHLGHAATFSTAASRVRGGELLLRIEDLDPARCRRGFVDAILEDLQWLGIEWTAGPVFQSKRRERYLAAWRRLRDEGLIYPCHRSRRDVATASLAPHGEESLFPPAWRADPAEGLAFKEPSGVNWRFRVPDERKVVFHDGNLGPQEAVAGREFGDFLVWNRDDVPAYELAVVVDDLADGISEVVRGGDLLLSTARQLLVYEALGGRPPSFFHCPLVCDESGRRLSKRAGAREIRSLRESGLSAAEVLALARQGTT